MGDLWLDARYNRAEIGDTDVGGWRMGESRDVPGPELCALTCKSYRDAPYTFTRNYLVMLSGS